MRSGRSWPYSGNIDAFTDTDAGKIDALVVPGRGDNDAHIDACPSTSTPGSTPVGCEACLARPSRQEPGRVGHILPDKTRDAPPDRRPSWQDRTTIGEPFF